MSLEPRVAVSLPVLNVEGATAVEAVWDMETQTLRLSVRERGADV
jgi:hypothetical protein